jgi:hypothetical protein
MQTRGEHYLKSLLSKEIVRVDLSYLSELLDEAEQVFDSSQVNIYLEP